MSTMRKVARNMARNMSYNQSGTTSGFHYFFEKIWREKTGHPVNRNAIGSPSATKKGHHQKYN